ncbi:uncharacterized protein LOC124349451 isoform X2 [Daphnia pulicaria]|uniref:uncharacterized protein LOC124349451 isoform X2 n=1 Tax=Daphnia pulicaria TaxID=35523 RepID=UPI001EE9D8B5|nr:uncharacterized protein LOC124349451 isoform X2 [Daphnia pulicaria]
MRNVLVITATFQLQSTSPNSSTLLLPVPIPAPSVIGSKNKFVMRKCCGPGQLYVSKKTGEIPDAERCVKFSVSSSHRQSPVVKKSREIFLGSKQSFPPRYSVEDVQVDAGFPRSCTPDGWDFLEPELRMGDLFYALSSGQLLVPHQFYFLEFDSYCIEDYADERNVTKVRRMAFVCSVQTRDFPTTAVDSSGKLRLDFVKSEDYAELLTSKFNARRVIRKCCGHNQSLDSFAGSNGKPACRENQVLVTRFFENLQELEDNSTSLFFRFGHANCSTRPIRTTVFQLHFNGSLEIMVDNTNANSNTRLVSIEDYCLDDMVEFGYVTHLPYATTYAFYCPGEEPSLIEPEFSDGPEVTDSPSTDPPPTYPPVTETTMSEPDPTYSNNDDQYDNSTLITIPKCCPPGHVMGEEYTCQPLWWWPTERPWDEPIEPAVVVSGSINDDLMTYHNNLSATLISNVTLSSCKAGQLQQPIPLFAQYSQIIPIFRIDPKHGVLVSFHTLVEYYWDVKSKINSFCVDQLFFRQEQDVYYNAQVFHCITIETFKSHRPIILLVSTAGLLATFVIYLFVPASGSAKLVLSAFGGKRNRGNGGIGGTNTMAKTLTGRILLCHVLSLALAFTCLAIVQLKLIESLQSSCIAIGYVTYWAFIASFSWLTVYCFDYYHIFSGSFKVTNEKLFIPYSAFGWGVPFLATTITSIAQFRSAALGISSPFNPNFGYDRCWFPDESSSALITFFYVPVGVLLLLDVNFFLCLMFNDNLMHCWQRQAMAIRSNRKNSTASKEHEDLKMAVKLFFITGIPWIFELIGYLVSRLDGSNVGLYYFFEFCVIINTSRGVFIFVNFILLNRDVRKFLWSRVKIISKREPPTLADGTAMHHTNTDNDQSTSNQTTQSTPATCSETISNLESFEYDEYTHL